MKGKEHLYRIGLESIGLTDGREVIFSAPLRPYLSEGALHRYRAIIMIENLIALSKAQFPGFPTVSVDEERIMRSLTNQNTFDSWAVAQYDHFGRNGVGPLEHDVKAVEYYLRELFDERELGHLKELIHFPMTSEDCNNLAWNLMLRGAINNVWLPMLLAVCDKLSSLSELYAVASVPGKTHGMNASPTTFGKRFAYFLDKISKILIKLATLRLSGKWSGPVGNHNAITLVAPGFDVEEYARSFVGSFGFTYSTVENQRNSHVEIVQLLSEIKNINIITTDLCENIRHGVMMEWLYQKGNESNVGSSVMPHKINPWFFENAQGVLEQSTIMIDGAISNLIPSVFERDLTDHPWERLYGDIIAKSLIGITYIKEGFQTLRVDDTKGVHDLYEMPEVLTEPVQIAGRILGVADIYIKIKNHSRGKSITKEVLNSIIDEYITDPILRQRLKDLEPFEYLGIAHRITMHAVTQYTETRTAVEQGILHPMTGIRAVLFDLDNTLHFGDKEELHARLSAINTSLAMGFDDEQLKMFGAQSDFQQMKKDMVLAYNQSISDKQLTEEDFQKANDAVTGNFDHYFYLAPSTKDLLKLLREKGYKVGLVTTRGGQSRDRVLKERHKIEDMFDVIIGRGDAKERKPHPEPAMKALRQLGILPGEALFVGDKQLDDVGVGNVLGMQTVLISTDELDTYGPLPTFQYSSLEQLTKLVASF